MTKIVDPFELLDKKLASESSNAEKQESELTSESAVCNEVHGVCPKCQNSMATSRIPNSKQDNLIDVFWCDACRVTTPKPAV